MTQTTDVECEVTPDCDGKDERDTAYPGKVVYRCLKNRTHNQYLVYEGEDAGMH